MKPADDPDFDYRALVRRGYDRCAPRYEAIRAREVESDVEQLIEVPQPGSQVLDVGCGAGVPIAKALVRRFRVTGVDLSREMITRARQNVPEATFVHADILEVDLPAAGFEAVVSFYTLFHLPKESHKVSVQRMHSWLSPGGYLLITVAREDEAPYTEDYLGVTMYWSNYGLPEYLAFLDEMGFEIIKVSSVGHGYLPGQGTGAETHPLIFARKSP